MTIVNVDPFLGLRPFSADDDLLFFGREQHVDELLGKLRRNRLVAVVGASGCGKSSLVQAGMLPALSGGYMAGAGSSWRIAVLRPGSRPVASLAGALAAALDDGEAAQDVRESFVHVDLERSAMGLVHVVQQARLEAHENLLVLVDQFEELFRFAVSPVDDYERNQFVQLLLTASSQSNQPIYIAIAMRADFLGECVRFRGLPEAVGAGLFIVPRMTRNELRRAIEGPVGVVGGQITPRLTATLLNEVGDDADLLPLLQHALQRTWMIWQAHRPDEQPLDVEHYAAAGGLSSALSQHAESIYSSLPDSGQRAAEGLFRCLTELDQNRRGLRRPTRFADACRITDTRPDQLRGVVEAFRTPSASFLMPPAGVALTGDTVLDITHEALLRLWPRLRAWMDTEDLSAQTYRRLAEDAARGRSLLRDGELAIAEAWRQRDRPNRPWAEQYAPDFERAMRFLDDSIAVGEREARRRGNRRLGTVVLAFAAGAMLVIALHLISGGRLLSP